MVCDLFLGFDTTIDDDGQLGEVFFELVSQIKSQWWDFTIFFGA